MADAAFPAARYPAYTTAELEAAIAAGADTHGLMTGEIERRARVAAGDTAVMTPGERLRFATNGKAR